MRSLIMEMAEAPQSGDLGGEVERLLGPSWASGGAIAARPVFSGLDLETRRELVARARTMDRSYEGPDLESFLAFDFLSDTGQETDVAQNVFKSSRVRSAWWACCLMCDDGRAHLGSPIEVTREVANPYRPEQGYLDAAPVGIGIDWAWKFQGGRGEDVRFVDVERAWDLNQED